MIIASLVFWVLFRINLLSTGWNIVVGIVGTALLFVATGLVRDE